MNYYSLNQYLKDTFGEKVYKIAIDGGFTCPNRDGTLGTRGCIFCSGNGSGDFAESRQGLRRDLEELTEQKQRHRLVSRLSTDSIHAQIERGKELLARKIKNGKYIAYFQAFTSTYAPVEQLRSLYMEAIRHPDIVALSIATRPDCLPEDVLELLEELNEIKPVWVELGLQTIHAHTAEYIRRGYDLPVYDDAVMRLKAAGINVITHVILGLPGESFDEMKATVRYVGESGSDGIKLQLLHVLKGTDLAKDYLAGKFQALTMEEYVQLVCDCLCLLPKEMVIHRITGDGDKRLLIAPEWSKDKKRVLNALQKAISER